MQSRPIATALLLLVAMLAGRLEAAEAAPGQGGDIQLGKMGWLPSQAFGIGQGLPDEMVRSITSLPDGHVWAGTMRGLAQQDGSHFLAEPGPGGVLGNAIASLETDPQGRLYAAVDGFGIYRRNTDGHWQALGTPARGQRTRRLRALTEGGHTRLLAIGAGIAEWRDGHWNPLPLPAEVLRHEVFDVALEPGQGNHPATLWVASFGAGLYRCIGTRDCQPIPIDVPGPRTDQARVLALQARPGHPATLWVGLQAGGVARLEDGHWTRWHTGNSNLPSDYVTALLPVTLPGVGNQLLAGTRSGVAILHAGVNQWVTADPRLPQLHERVQAMVLARTSQSDPVVWVGSETGATRMPLTAPWRMISAIGMRANGVWDLLVERTPRNTRRLWLASDGEGLALLENGHWSNFGRDEGVPNGVVRSVLRVHDGSPEGSLWISTWEGHIARLQGQRFVELPTPWPKTPVEVVTLLLADGASVWAGTRENGVARWDGRHWQWWRESARFPPRFYAAVRIGQDLWFTTNTHGLARYRNGQWRFFGAAEGLTNDALYDMHLLPDPDGKPLLWIGSANSGLVRVDVGNPEQPRLVTRPALPKPPLGRTYGAVRDGQGALLLCTDYGVYRWQFANGHYSSTTYLRQDGIPHNECNGKALQEDDRGRVWIGTAGGAAVFTPRPQRPRKPSPFVLTRLSVDGQPARMQAGVIQLPRPDSRLELRYNLLTGEREAETRTRFQLLDGDPAASPWETNDTLYITRLSSGRQRIRIDAMDFAGIPAKPIELVADVPRIWWQDPWIFVLSLIPLGLLGWGYSQLRTRRLHRQASTLQAMVEARTLQLQANEAKLRTANEALYHLAYIDALTGLGNRRRLFETLNGYAHAQGRPAAPLSVLMIDLDHFKKLNDSHGHQMGDRCLQAFASCVKQWLPAQALACRYGGEEFCILLPAIPETDAALLAEDLRKRVEAIEGSGEPPPLPRVTISIGLSSLVPGESSDKLLSIADHALYLAKQQGRNRLIRARR